MTCPVGKIKFDRCGNGYNYSIIYDITEMSDVIKEERE